MTIATTVGVAAVSPALGGQHDAVRFCVVVDVDVLCGCESASHVDVVVVAPQQPVGPAVLDLVALGRQIVIAALGSGDHTKSERVGRRK
jgi:hypothetical protein